METKKKPKERKPKIKARLIYEGHPVGLAKIVTRLFKIIKKEYQEEFNKGIIKVYPDKKDRLILEVSQDAEFVLDFVKGFKSTKMKLERALARATGIKISLETEGI